MSPRRKRQKVSEDFEIVTQALHDVKQQYHQPQTNNDPDLIVPSAQSKLPRSLFVRSLPENATSETLAAHFSRSYPLKHATVVTDRETKKPKGYGFVTFADAEDAQKAKEEFNGSVYDGRKIRVETAEPRHRDTAAEPVDALLRSKSNFEIPKAKARRQTQAEHKPQTKLIVRNLPWSIKESSQLASLFRSYGKIKHATLPKQASGLLSGFGFVVLRGGKNTEKAITEMNGKVVDGRTLAVDWAVKKHIWQSQQKPSDRWQAPNIGEDAEVERSGSLASGSTESGGSHIVADEMTPLVDDERLRESSKTFDPVESIGQRSPATNPDPSNGDPKSEDYSRTLFVRNLPFLTDDEGLSDHFEQFGPLQYARVVMDTDTERSRGTGFVCFRDPKDARDCLRRAPKPHMMQPKALKGSRFHAKHSILEDTQADPLGHFTIDGRVLQVSRAVDREQARRLTLEGQSAREARDKDKRRLYLLAEGTVTEGSLLHTTMTEQELKLRSDSLRQRQALAKSNPSLHLSLTRLSVRNLPRHLSSKELKALAREAVVGFAKDVKQGRRQRLSTEEIGRGGESMKDAERKRKASGKGIVKQAKIVFEGRDGGKVTETSGAGKSRGYGFIEYTSHRWALMGLRWLNGHKVTTSERGTGVTKQNIQRQQDRSKRLVVEFAIENAQVVARRQNREQKSRSTPQSGVSTGIAGLPEGPTSLNGVGNKSTALGMTKQVEEDAQSLGPLRSKDPTPAARLTKDPGKAKRNRIIAKKRMQRRSRKVSKT